MGSKKSTRGISLYIEGRKKEEEEEEEEDKKMKMKNLTNE